jgi:hypothetical protein
MYKTVQNDGNWLAGRTYTYYVSAHWQYLELPRPTIFEVQMLEDDLLSSYYWGPWSDGTYTRQIGKGFLFSKSTYDSIFNIEGFAVNNNHWYGPWTFAGNTMKGPIITNVELLPEANQKRDPWSGKMMEWLDEYLFGVWLKVTVSLPASLPDGLYYLLSLQSQHSIHWAWPDDFHHSMTLPRRIYVGEDYWPGGSENPYPEAPEADVKAEFDDFDVESLPITISTHIPDPNPLPSGGSYPPHSVLSVAVIPGETEDEVWMLTRRIIGGAGPCFLEQMQPRNYGYLEDAWFVDCGLSYDRTPATEFSGLDHLEGEEVCILADGVVLERQTVMDGKIVLSSPVSRCIIGLPFRSTVKPMRFDIHTPGGTTKGSLKRFAELVISFFESAGAKYGVDVDNLFEIDWPDDELYTGDKVVAHEGGFSVEDSVIITTDEPLPLIVRAMIPRIEKTGR